MGHERRTDTDECFKQDFAAGRGRVADAATGVALMVVPAVVAFLLLTLAEISPEALVFARMVGAALLCIGVAIWLARADTRSAAQRAQVVG